MHELCLFLFQIHGHMKMHVTCTNSSLFKKFQLGLQDDFFDVRDLFEQSSLGTFYKDLIITVPPVGVVMLKISAYDSRSL